MRFRPRQGTRLQLWQSVTMTWLVGNLCGMPYLSHFYGPPAAILLMLNNTRLDSFKFHS